MNKAAPAVLGIGANKRKKLQASSVNRTDAAESEIWLLTKVAKPSGLCHFLGAGVRRVKPIFF
jgi:hypothetical protein